MGVKTGVDWCDHTHNRWWGCVRDGEECRFCYAETWAGRFGVEWGPQGRRRFFDAKHLNEALAWNRAAEKAGLVRSVFCMSMGDLFELLPARHPDYLQMAADRESLWPLIERTPWLFWLLLTKRPQNVPGMVPSRWMDGHWPKNAGVGTTAGDQKGADRRVPPLLQVPAPFRFVSYEPALGVLDLYRWLFRTVGVGEQCRTEPMPRIDWLICGGESGNAGQAVRPMHPGFARSARDQAVAAGVPFWFKQWGQHSANLVRLGSKREAGDELDGRRWKQRPDWTVLLREGRVELVDCAEPVAAR